MNYPVGFRFDPEDDELINYYLLLKRLGGYDSEVNDVICEVNILDFEPWKLPEKSKIRSNDRFWFFFYILDYKKNLAIRKTNNGFWKITGSKHIVRSRDTNEKIGIKKILTYYKGKSSNAVKTNWVIHEYHPTARNFPSQRPYVVCRLKEKDDETAHNFTPDEGEPSHRGLFDSGDISENTSPEDNPFLLSNLESLIANGLLDYDSSSALQSQMVMEQGQNLPFTNGFCDDFNGLQYDVDSTEQEDDDLLNSLLESQYGQELGTSSLFNGHATTKEYRQMQMVQTFSGTLPASSHDSFVDSSTNVPYHINCMQLGSEEIPLHKSQPRSHRILAERAVPTIFELQRDFSRKAVIKDKVREVAKHGTAVDLLKKENSNVESNKDMKMNQKTNTKKSLKLSWNEPARSDQKGFFIFMDTPPLNHSSNPSLGYLINTFLGIFLLIVVIREVILFGDWY